MKPLENVAVGEDYQLRQVDVVPRSGRCSPGSLFRRMGGVISPYPIGVDSEVAAAMVSLMSRMMPLILTLVIMSSVATVFTVHTRYSVARYVRLYREDASVIDELGRLRVEDGGSGEAQRPHHTLVIFTSFDERSDKPYHAFAHRIALKNWAHFVPSIQPLLFLRNTSLNGSLAEAARQAGWHVYPLTAVSEYGVPRLKAMYRRAFDSYNSTFYGYANGDIIFDGSLLSTLRSIISRNLSQHLDGNVLVIGQRRNVEINLNETVAVYDVPRLHEMAVQRSWLFSPWGVDFFFFTRDNCTLNWTAVADVVIGRPAYDNYLVVISARYGVNIVDATMTLNAIHLSTPGVPHEGSRNSDSWYNFHVIGGGIDYNGGLVSCAKLVTQYDARGREYVVNRTLATQVPE